MFAKIRKLFGAQDMTVGSPTKCLLLLSVPMFLGNIAQVLYGAVSAIIVGRFIGDAALAAIGTCQPIQFLFMVFFMTIGTGVTVMVSQYYGAREYHKLSDCIGSSFTLILIASVVIMCCAPFSGPILRLIETPDEIFGMANSFLFIIFIGNLGIGLFNIVSGVLRGLGDAVFPLVVLVVTVTLQAIMDLLVVLVFGWGVVGIAYVMIFSQLLAAIACLYKIMKLKGIITLNRDTLRPKKEMISHIMRLGLPAGISQGIMSLSFLFVQSLVNSMGTLIVTCTTAVMRVDQFAMMPNMAFNMSASTFTGQNIGANRMDRVKTGARTVVIMGFITSLVLVGLILVFGKDLIALFTKTPEVIEIGGRMLFIMAFGYIAMAFMQTYGGILRGAGDTMAAMWITIATNVVLRIPIAYLWAHLTKSEAYPKGHPDSIYASMMIAFVLGAIATYIYFRTGKWKEKALIRANIPSENPDNESPADVPV